MGIDFIYGRKHIYQKSWARGIDRVKTPDLYTLKPEEIHTILMRPLGGYRAGKDDEYELQLSGRRIDVYRNRIQIGVGINVPQSITDALKGIGGKTMGFFHRMRNQSGLIDIKIWIWALN